MLTQKNSKNAKIVTFCTIWCIWVMVVHMRNEPRRVCRRLQLLRRWSHDDNGNYEQDSHEVRERAVLEHAGECPTRRAAVVPIAAKIGCAARTLHDWTKKAEVDGGKRAGVPSEVAEKLEA